MERGVTFFPCRFKDCILESESTCNVTLLSIATNISVLLPLFVGFSNQIPPRKLKTEGRKKEEQGEIELNRKQHKGKTFWRLVASSFFSATSEYLQIVLAAGSSRNEDDFWMAKDTFHWNESTNGGIPNHSIDDVWKMFQLHRGGENDLKISCPRNSCVSAIDTPITETFSAFRNVFFLSLRSEIPQTCDKNCVQTYWWVSREMWPLTRHEVDW